MKNILFYAFLFLLFIPLLRQINIIPIHDFELDGNFELHDNVELNWHNWVNGVYQQNADALATENIGYRGFATRLETRLIIQYLSWRIPIKPLLEKTIYYLTNGI